MSFSLPPHLEELVLQKVASGQYDSVRQVIEEALLLLEERDVIRVIRKDRLVDEIAKGIYQADNRQLVDRAEVYRALHRKPASANE
jgi:antitoxin ParD1/3/4